MHKNVVDYCINIELTAKYTYVIRAMFDISFKKYSLTERGS